MKYLRKYSLLESNQYNLIELNDWEDFKDLITSVILDKWDIDSDLVRESIPGKSGNYLLEPVLHININQYYNNDEPLDIIKDCRNLHLQVYQMTGKFINVDWSSQQINIILDDIPNHWTILKDFNHFNQNFEYYYQNKFRNYFSFNYDAIIEESFKIILLK